MEVPSPSRLDIFAIGIREELRKPHPIGPSIGKTNTSYSSMEFLNLPPSGQEAMIRGVLLNHYRDSLCAVGAGQFILAKWEAICTP